MPEIHFFNDEVDFELLNAKGIVSWILDIAEEEGRKLKDLNIILTTDERLLEVNKEFLKHDFYTDIITFQNEGEEISGEIYISLERIKENALTNSVEMEDELHRVMAHGLLHLIGYKDKSPEEQKTMRSREEFCLNLRTF